MAYFALQVPMGEDEAPVIHLLPGRAYDSNILLLDGDRPVLVDTGTGAVTEHYTGRVRELLGDRGLDRIVLTHGHFDHAGGAAAMAREFDVPVYIHEEGLALLASGDPRVTGAWLFGATPEPVEGRPLKEGDVIDVGPCAFEVLHTPGHALHAIALWHEPSRTLVPGDTVYADGGIGRWDLAGGDYDQLVSSLERLAALRPESMFPGHGPAVRSGAVDHVLMGLRMAKMYGGI